MTRFQSDGQRPAKIARWAWLAGVLLAWAGAVQAALPIEHWVSTRGARVVFVPATAVPILDVQVDFDAGERRDPPQRSGLAALTVALLGRGAAGWDEATIAERWADWGVQRGAAASDDRASVTLRTLSDPAQRGPALDLLARILARPTFPEAALLRERERTIQSLRESLSRPDGIAQRALYGRLYPGHPYGQLASPESLAAVRRADVQAFYRDHYAAGRAVVTLVGAITRPEAEAIAEQLTRDLPAGRPMPALPPVRKPAGSETWLEHPATQSHIMLGEPAVARSDPAFFPLLVGNHVLGGGGFVSRLMREVREQRGLTYGVSSGFSPMFQEGPFIITLQTRREQAAQALAVVRQTLTDFLAQGPTPEELQAAQDNLIGGFALRLDSQRAQLDLVAMMAWYGLPLDYLERWPEQVAAVTVAQVQAAFARVLDAQRMVTVVVGGAAPHGAQP